MPDQQLPTVLKRLINAVPFEGSQVRFAAHVGLDLPSINRVIRGRVKASPAIVRKISGALSRDEATAVLTAYLSDLASEILASDPQRTAKVSVQLRQHRS